MKHLKLFFALFAMLALGVGNAWGAEKITDYSKIVTGKTYYIGATTGGTDYYLSVSGASTSTSIAGTAKTDKANATAFVFTGSGTSWTIKFADYANYLGLKSSKDNGKVQVVSSAATFTASNQSGKLRLSIGSYSIQKNNSGTQFGSYGNTQTDIWLEEVPGSSEPTTQYTVKWYTAIGSSDDVKYDEGATITKPATDPTMSGYEFMGWTDQCSVAEDGTGFTALTNFGTADADKEFYAVFAVATTTGGGGSATETTATVTVKDYASANSWVNGTKYTSLKVDANITASVTGSSNTGKYYTSGNEWRIYQNENPTLTLTAADGNTIKTAKVTYNINNTGVLKLNGANVTSGTASNINASSVTYNVGNTGSATNGQVKVTAIEVVYTSGSASVTTYSDYTTTCSGATVVETLTDAQFAWSAATAEATMGATNTFPTLTNTVPVSVTYESSTPATATIAADGTITLVAPGTTTISAKFAGGEVSGTTYAAKTVTYALTVLKAAAVPTDTRYVKVTKTANITDGEYLIVYEDAASTPSVPVIFDGSLATLDAAGNMKSVTISSNVINGDTEIDAATFTISTMTGGFAVKSKSGKYIGRTSSGNGINTGNSEILNTITITDGVVKIAGSGSGASTSLQYYSVSGQERFRYYGTTQKAIALYKKASSHTLTYGTCTNGSVSADVADGATVLSGTTITLTATPATDYKLSAYDVYKTDDATTKVTVTDGKFIMPEYDVTISATFELAKTLTSIEITNDATQTTFWQNETFNHNGLKVIAHFDGADNEDVTDKVTVTGSTATAGATVEVTVSYNEGATTETATYNITVKAIPNTQETAYTVADAFDIIDKLTTADGVFIKGIVSQVDEYLSSYKSITYWISDDGTTTKQLQVYSGKGVDGEEFSDINGVSKADQVIVCGTLKNYKGTYEFDKNNYLAEHTKTTKADPELSYTTTEYNVNLGEVFTAPTLNNPHTLAVTYSSSNEDVATVASDGSVTIKAAGIVKITASFAGNEDYVAGSASYTINITDPNQLEVTFDAEKDIPSEGLTLSKNNVSMTFSAGTMNNGSEYRCNASNTMTISYADGVITKVVLNCTANGTTKYGPGCFTTEVGDYTYSEKVGTWTGETKSVVFTSGQQVRMTTVTVYYKQDKRTNAGLAWSEESINLTVGDAFTAPTFSNPNSLNVNFESDNTTLATVSNTGVISLNAGVTGTAVITASYEGDATYKDAAVTCTITVNPKTETVVILAQYNGQWYALQAAYFSTYTNRLAALPVNYVGGKLYNVEEADKATIEWQLAVSGTKATFKNGENYLTGANGTDLKLGTATFEWDYNGELFLTDGDSRTFIYHKDGYFRNYATSNAIPNSTTYSDKPVVTAPVYDTAIEIGSGDNSTVIAANQGKTVKVIVDRSFEAGDEWYTLCVPFNMQASVIGKAYQISGLVQKTTDYVEVNLAEKTTIVAGEPYLIKPTVTVDKFVVENVTIVNTTGESIAKSINGLSVAMQGVINGIGDTTGDLYWVGNSGYLYNDDVAKSGLRAYFNITTSSGIAPRMRVVAGENVETGIEDIITTDTPVKVIENGQLVIIRDGVKYNVQGQKL